MSDTEPRDGRAGARTHLLALIRAPARAYTCVGLYILCRCGVRD